MWETMAMDGPDGPMGVDPLRSHCKRIVDTAGHQLHRCNSAISWSPSPSWNSPRVESSPGVIGCLEMLSSPHFFGIRILSRWENRHGHGVNGWFQRIKALFVFFGILFVCGGCRATESLQDDTPNVDRGSYRCSKKK